VLPPNKGCPQQALSTRHPWAYLIAAGDKDIENRTWRTEFRGRIWIHASRAFDREFPFKRPCSTEEIEHEVFSRAARFVSERPDFSGAIIGEVDIVDCVTRHESPWFEGPYGFVLEGAVLYDKPIRSRGQLKFYVPSMASVNGGEWRLL